MATMATRSHALSVFINSCVKNSHDPQTGLSITSRERSSGPGRVAAPESQCENVFSDVPVLDKFGDAAAQPSLEEVETQLKNLTNEQFYSKLQQLKEANRKTLEECEKLYKQKYGNDENENAERRSAKEMVESMFAARLGKCTGERSKHVGDNAGLWENPIDAPTCSDSPPHFSAKPPAGSYVKRATNVSVACKTEPSCPQSVRQRPASAPESRQPSHCAFGLVEEEWHKTMQQSDMSELSDKDADKPDSQLAIAISRIENMWHGFKIDGYPSETSKSSASRTGNEVKQDKWRHRITVPKPFQMTVRDETKVTKKTKTEIELEEKLLQKEREEEMECQKKFQARPAPAHIYLPLFDEIRERNEARRRHVKEYTTQLLLSRLKPFKFEKRDLEKKESPHCASMAEHILHCQGATQKNETFKAKPVPSFLQNNEELEKKLEEEEFRKIRRKLRAQELLKQSSLPPNMAMLQKRKEQKEKQKILDSKTKKGAHIRRSKSAHSVPDHDQLYEEFYEELARRKKDHEGTIVEPFNLRKPMHLTKTHRLRQYTQQHRLKVKNSGSPAWTMSCLSRSNLQDLSYLSLSLDSIPVKSTSTFDRRADIRRSQQMEDQRAKQQRKEEEHRRSIREAKLRKHLLEYSTLVTPQKHTEDCLKRHRTQEREQRERYEKEMEEMQKRVESQPFMFERVSQMAAGKVAERKFKSTLKNVGLDEELVYAGSARGAGLLSDDGDKEP